jgi:hypothetical protein
VTTPLTREAVKALRDDPARIALDEDDDAYLLPSGAANNLVAIPARDDFAGEYQILTPEIWQQMVERFNAAPDLAAALLAAWDERDAVQKEFDAVVAMLSEMHGAEYSRAEAAEVKLAEYSDARDRQFNLICMLHAKLAERDAEIARLRDAATAWQAFKDAHTVTDHWASVDRLDRALLNKEPTP